MNGKIHGVQEVLYYSCLPYMGKRATHGRSRKKKSGTPMKMNRNMSAPKGRSFSRDAKSARGSLFFRRSLFNPLGYG